MNLHPPHRGTVGSRVAALVVAVLACLVVNPASGAAPKVGEPFPKLDAFELEGKLPETTGKVVLIDFWASWCGPCQKAFPTLKQLHTTYANRGFLVLAVSVDEKKAAMNTFLKKQTPEFPVMRDAKGKLSEAIGLDTVPTSFLVGRDGKVRAIHQGFDGENSSKQLTAEIETALVAGTP
jgi:thiol-disulfide isomerase/thioredoxin